MKQLFSFFSVVLFVCDLNAQTIERWRIVFSDGTRSEYQLGEIQYIDFVNRSSDLNQEGTIAEAIDLGLSTRWASWNIGATKPSECGSYFGWADPIGDKVSTNSNDYHPEITTITGTEYDAATMRWGKPWRIPTKAEWEELIDCCTWKFIELETEAGWLVTGPNANSIFLPMAECRIGVNNPTNFSIGDYAIGDAHEEVWLTLEDGVKIYNRDLSIGLSIRPVFVSTSPFFIVTQQAELPSNNGAATTIEIKSNCEWNIQSTSIPSWLNVSPTNGKGDATITLRATSANTSAAARTATLRFINMASGIAEVNVTQAFSNPTPLTIRVYTGKVLDSNYTKATITGEVTGTSEDVEVGIIYAKTSDLSELNGKKVRTVSSGDFTVTLSGLFDGLTYYYRAYALLDGKYYWGETESFTTPTYTYNINGTTYKMVHIDDGDMPPFSIMQTEMTNDKVNSNNDAAITKAEFRYFLEMLRAETGLPLRLPTTEEWQYAARGGSKGLGYKYSGSDDINDVAWYSGNSSREPHPVGTKQPNELGLYDMSGNYAELVNDKTDIFYVDGSIFGGSYKDSAYKCTPNSSETGRVTGLVEGSKSVREQNAYNASYISFRLVYSAE